MRIENARPKFGGRLKTQDYYRDLNSVVRVLRDHSTLRVICDHLNAQLFTTPTGLRWTRDRLSAYLKANDINTTKE